jgi:hypothetical protein
LRARDTEVEQRTADLGHTALGERPVQLIETLTTRSDPVSELCEFFQCCGNRISVLVDTEKLNVCAPSQQFMAGTESKMAVTQQISTERLSNAQDPTPPDKRRLLSRLLVGRGGEQPKLVGDEDRLLA